jgi:hypothetical protein
LRRGPCPSGRTPGAVLPAIDFRISGRHLDSNFSQPRAKLLDPKAAKARQAEQRRGHEEPCQERFWRAHARTGQQLHGSRHDGPMAVARKQRPTRPQSLAGGAPGPVLNSHCGKAAPGRKSRLSRRGWRLTALRKAPGAPAAILDPNALLAVHSTWHLPSAARCSPYSHSASRPGQQQRVLLWRLPTNTARARLARLRYLLLGLQPGQQL